MNKEGKAENPRPRVGLVLGSGSARGLAHIGVIQALEEHGIPIDFIVGCSIGAVVGGIYASGADMKMLDKMVECIDTSLLLDFRIPRMGFVEGRKIKYFLDLLTKNQQFSDLRIPLIVVATDLISGERVLLESGPVSEAIRASMSIPGVFQPVMREGMVLVDGAVVDRLPVEVARERGADVVIAVEVNYTHAREVIINNTLDVILTSLDLMQKPHFDLVSQKADILIKPEVGHFSSRDFNKSRLLVDLGKNAADARIAELQELILAGSRAREAISEA